jgi:cytochrome c oxidase subunit 3
MGGGPAGFSPPRRDGGDDGDGPPQKLPLGVYKIAMMTGLAAILMMFAGLISAFVARGMASNWKPVALPKTLWLSTLLLLGSSWALVRAQRFLRADAHTGYKKWLTVTAALGLAFVWSQTASWAQLATQGVFLAGSPHSSFFYLFTGLHTVHILGGLTALAWLVWTARRGVPETEYGREKRKALAGAAAMYWHFMDGLWVCLFALLLLWT